MKKFLFAVIFLFLLSVNYSCSDDTKKINEFWKYISENEENIFALNDLNSALYNEAYNKI